jgi:uncharacterized protein (TIGR02646 family)
MRLVDRPQLPIPQVLIGSAVLEARAALAEHYALPEQDRLRRRPPLNSKIWLHEGVLDALTRLFHGKCAYCESVLIQSSVEHVHHFRPTNNAADPRSGRSNQHPDCYGWLAYEWKNLLLVCLDCGRSKRNFFPVDGPRAPPLCTWEEANDTEQELIIDPCSLEPRKHLSFSVDGYSRGRRSIGIATIELLGLNRPQLVEQRSKKFLLCLNLFELITRRDEEAIKGLESELNDATPYAGAARIWLHGLLSDYARYVRMSKPSFKTLEKDAVRIALLTSDQQWRMFNSLEATSSTVVRDFHASVAESLALTASEPEHGTALVRRIHIRNFKGLSDLTLEIPAGSSSDVGSPCAMLLGENSTGKSTTLQAIALAVMGSKMRERLRLRAEDFLPREASGWQLTGTRRPEVMVEFDTGEPVSLRIDPLSQEFQGIEKPSMIVFAFGARRFFGKASTRKQKIANVKSLFDPLATIAHPGAWLQGLGGTEFDAVARAMREVLALSEEDSIGRDDEGRLFVRAHGRDTPLTRLSDGYRSLFAMTIDVMRGMVEAWGNLENARGLVLIDEIETHLHPRWKLRVVSALRSAMPLVQFIATTHDPLCLRGMRNGEVHVLVRNEDRHVEVLTGLPDVRGLRAEQLLTSDYFGLASTSDPEIESALEDLAIHGDQSSREKALESLRPFQWIGDTPMEQIVNEALRRHIAASQRTAAIDRREVRESAVRAVLERLQQHRREGNQ